MTQFTKPLLLVLLFTNFLNEQQTTAQTTLDYGYYYTTYYGVQKQSELFLLGKVKSVVYDNGTYYKFNEAGQVTESLIKLFDKPTQYTYKYDSLNRLIERTQTGGPANVKFNQKITYDDSAFTCVIKDGHTDTIVPNTKKFNKDWLLISEGGTVFSYGKNAVPLSECSTYSCVKWTYDTKNRPVTKTNATSVDKYFFQEDGKIKTLEKWESGKIKKKFSYTYNSTGSLIRVTTTDYRDWLDKSTGMPATNVLVTLYKMEYDSESNWISAHITLATGVVETMSRVITYY